jgi:hypothetical protein
MAELTLTDEQNETLLRKLDRMIHWHSFLYHSNIHAHDMIVELYGPKVIDTAYYVAARTKIYDNIKSYKHRMLARVEVSISS